MTAISRRKRSEVDEAYEKAARLTGASVCRIRLAFPDGKINVTSAFKLPAAEKDSFTREELMRVFGVSAAAVDKWVRMGRLSAEPNGAEADSLYRSAQDGVILGSRRNKGFASGNADSGSYLGECPENELVCELARRFPSPDEDTVRTVLCELALRLMKSAGMLAGETDGALFAGFLYSEISAGAYDALLNALAPENADMPSLDKLGGIEPDYNRGQDFLGAAYISMTDKRKRKLCGLYFTPEHLARSVVAHIRDEARGDVCDPCCGSGMLLMKCASESCELYGSDIDDICVNITRINLALLTRPDGVEKLMENIVTRNIFDAPQHEKFDLIITNPPWGAEVNEHRKRLKRDSCDIITEHCAQMLKPSGRLAIILPEAVLSARAHRIIRYTLMNRLSLSLLEYPKEGFGDVWCPCVIAVAVNTPDNGKVRVISERGSFDTVSRPDDYSMLITDAELNVLKSMEKAGSLSLHENADFALGIVTGANHAMVSKTRLEGMEPILRGTDIFPFVYSEPQSFIYFEPKRFQQCPDEARFRVPAKIVYRFIGKKPVFAIDTRGLLTLNSCNTFVPRIEGLSIYVILAILNSVPSLFYLSARFSSRKLLRRHIEALPIAMPCEEDCALLDAAARRLASGDKDEKLFDTVNDAVCRAYKLSDEHVRVMKKALNYVAKASERTI